MEYRILGPVEALTDVGAVPLGGALERALLARLLLEPGRAVSVSRLVDDLWGADPPPSAAISVRVRVSHLRKSLAAAGAGDAIVTRPGGYAVVPAPGDRVDALAFFELARRGRVALRAGDHASAADNLREALSLWRGAALADVGDASFACIEAARLDEERLAVVEDRVDADLALGRHAEVAGELGALASEHPLRERLCGQLMLALYRCGRQGEALAAFQRLRRTLSDELGIDPSTELSRLEARILHQDPELDVAVQHGSPTGAGARDVATGVVTFLLTDIEGSTQLWDADPVAMATVLERHDRLIAGAVSEGGGHLIKSKGEGDSTLSVFGRATDAVRVALQVEDVFTSEPWPAGFAPRVRVALHTGEAHERDGDYFGPAVNRAARLRALAVGGQTLMSAVTADVVRDHLPGAARLLDRGEHRLRGLSSAERVYELTIGVSTPKDIRASDGSRAHGVPEFRTSFVGREADVDGLVERLRHSRLLTLVGTGGTGKTRLAAEAMQRVADDYEHGAWFVALAPLGDESLVPAATSAALELSSQAATDATEEVTSWLRRRQALLVLDNCEHVLGGASRLAEAILDACPRVTLLTTSREPIGLGGEEVVRVAPLPTPVTDDLDEVARSPASRLFLERAASAGAAPMSSIAELSAVARLVRSFDGLPLAIELAAARAASLSPAELERHVDDRRELLRSRRRDLPERHRGLTELIDWSHALLDDSEKRVFRRLAVFAGSATFEAADCVCGPLEGASVTRVLGDLVDRSLVVADGDRGGRWSMLQTIRDYALERLRDAGELDTYLERHAVWALDLAREAHTAIEGPEQIRFLDTLDAERNNVRAAFDHLITSRDARAVALAGSLGPFWWIRGPISEGWAMLARAIALAGEDADAARAYGEAARLRIGSEAARGYIERAIALAEEVCDERLALLPLRMLGQLAEYQGNYAEQFAIESRILRIAETVGDGTHAAIALVNLAHRELSQHRPDAASELLDRADICVRQCGNPRVAIHVGHLRGWVRYEQGKFAEAAVAQDEPLRLALATRDERERAFVLFARGRALSLLGRLDDAQRDLEACTLIAERREDEELTSMACWARADLELRSGHPRDAITRGRAGLVTARVVEERYRRLLVEVIGRALVELGNARLGAVLLGAAGAMHERVGVPQSAPDRDGVREALESVHSRLEEAEDLLASGALLGDGEAVALALSADVVDATSSPGPV